MVRLVDSDFVKITQMCVYSSSDVVHYRSDVWWCYVFFNGCIKWIKTVNMVTKSYISNRLYFQLSIHQRTLYIYITQNIKPLNIYAFGRHIQGIHFILAFPENQTHDLGIVNTMHYSLSYTSQH